MEDRHHIEYKEDITLFCAFATVAGAGLGAWAEGAIGLLGLGVAMALICYLTVQYIVSDRRSECKRVCPGYY
jgi:hypothetical protein